MATPRFGTRQPPDAVGEGASGIDCSSGIKKIGLGRFLITVCCFSAIETIPRDAHLA